MNHQTPATSRIFRTGEPGYKRCSSCIMDTTDPCIEFDGSGRCNHCRQVDRIRPRWNPDGDPESLEILVDRIKRDGRHCPYDVILGISGGIDSSYLAMLARKLDLRVLLVHTDTGWNSEEAVHNIANIVSVLKLDLETHVVDWEEMRDLQHAFFKAGVPNQDIPQDHAIFAAFYSFAKRYRVKWALSGSNYASESILPASWGYDAMDAAHIRDIHRRFGTIALHRYPLMSFWKSRVQYGALNSINTARFLNLIPYSKEDAIRELATSVNWRYYGGKHYESRFTRFFQGWYLPHRWGYDKRLAHLSSLVVVGQMSRDAALDAMRSPSLSDEEIAAERHYMANKLGLSKDEFEVLMRAPLAEHSAYARTSAEMRHRVELVAAIYRRIARRRLGIKTG